MQDVRRIAFVTQRFVELQGLVPAAYGAALVLGALCAHAAGLRQSSVGTTRPFILAGLGLALMPHLQRAYRQSFGDPVVDTKRRILAAMGTTLVSIGAVADMSILSTNVQAPSLAAVALLGWSLWIVSRDWPWRVHHMVPAAAGLIGAIITAAAPAIRSEWGVMTPGRAEPYLLACSLIGLGIAAAGLMDHHLLVRSLERTTPEAVLVEAADRTSRFYRRVVMPLAVSLVMGIAVSSLSAAALSVVAPLMLLLPLAMCQLLWSFDEIRIQARAISRYERPPAIRGPALPMRPAVLVLLFAIVLAAAIDAALPVSAAPLALTASLALACAWAAAREWPRGRRYSIGAAAFAIVLIAMPSMAPVRALAALICAGSMALAFGGAIDLATEPNARRG